MSLLPFQHIRYSIDPTNYIYFCAIDFFMIITYNSFRSINTLNVYEFFFWKGGSRMAFSYKPQVPLAIKHGMTKSFINELAKNRITKSYWEECSSSKKIISKENMAILKEMARGGNDRKS